MATGCAGNAPEPISNCTNINEKPDAIKMLDVIDIIKKKGCVQSRSNIVETCENVLTWSRERALAAIDAAKDQKVIIEVKAHGKILYRRNSDINVYFEDVPSQEPKSPDSSNEIQALWDDFRDFKKCMWDEMASFRISLQEADSGSNETRAAQAEKALINSLYERIHSLERQLGEKQIIISTLLDTKRQGEGLRPMNSTSPIKTSQAADNSIVVIDNDKGNNVTTKDKGNAGETQKEQKNRSQGTDKASQKQNNGEKIPAVQNQPSAPKQKLHITIVGDSMMNGINDKGLSRDHHVTVRKHPGATSEDIKDYIKPPARRKPDVMIIHCGTNDLTKKDADTVQCLRDAISTIREIAPNTKIALSNVVTRTDGKKKSDLLKEVESLNRKIKALSIEEKVLIIDNTNLDETCLGKKGLHLSKRGNAMLAKTL